MIGAPTPRRAIASGVAVCLTVSLALIVLVTQGRGVANWHLNQMATAYS